MVWAGLVFCDLIVLYLLVSIEQVFLVVSMLLNRVEASCSENRRLYFVKGIFRAWTMNDQRNVEVL